MDLKNFTDADLFERMFRGEQLTAHEQRQIDAAANANDCDSSRPAPTKHSPDWKHDLHSQWQGE